ncbi:MAG: DUF1080 domain-containing protein, partial [Planctomycetaceae bacterium]|nr:DUF1080 domain-containing protein [Planctomycetaceae bacterium]
MLKNLCSLRTLFSVQCLVLCFSVPCFCGCADASGQPTDEKDETGQKNEPVAESESGFQSLFDGKTLHGWNGDQTVFRIEDGAIVGGQLQEKIPHNFFLSTEREYSDFELRLQFRLKGDDTNAGIQIRSRRIPDHHEMIGYQADLGQNYWGCLYDESRRRKVLAQPDAA